MVTCRLDGLPHVCLALRTATRVSHHLYNRVMVVVEVMDGGHGIDTKGHVQTVLCKQHTQV